MLPTWYVVPASIGLPLNWKLSDRLGNGIGQPSYWAER